MVDHLPAAALQPKGSVPTPSRNLNEATQDRHVVNPPPLPSTLGQTSFGGRWPSIEEALAEIPCESPQGLDSELAKAYEAVAVGVRECTRLIAYAPRLDRDEAQYRRLAESVHQAAKSALVAHAVVDLRLRRAGGHNTLLEALNHVIAVRNRAPIDAEDVAGGLIAVLVGLQTNTAGLFARVEGRGVIDRMIGQLALVPPPAELEERRQKSPTNEQADADRRPRKKPKGVPADEAEIRVREWLATNARNDPGSVTRDTVASDTGVSAGAVSKTAAWKAFRKRRDADSKIVPRDVPLTDAMKVSMPADDDNEDLEFWVESQAKEAARDERHQGRGGRRHERRHGPS